MSTTRVRPGEIPKNRDFVISAEAGSAPVDRRTMPVLRVLPARRMTASSSAPVSSIVVERMSTLIIVLYHH